MRLTTTVGALVLFSVCLVILPHSDATELGEADETVTRDSVDNG
jgi:hypothetical protein